MRVLLGMLGVVGALLLHHDRADAVEAEASLDIRQRIQQRLPKSPDDELNRLYALTGFEPLWHGASPSPGTRRALLDEIRHRRAYGLSEDMACARMRSEVRTPDGEAAADIAMSSCFLDMRNAIAHGRASQKELGDWFLSGDGRALTAADIADIRQGNIRGSLLRAAPQSPEYVALQQALAVYLTFEANGGWRSVEETAEVIFDGTDARVPGLIRRLAAEAYLASEESISTDTIVSAVRRFQADKGLVVDGRVGRQTLAALNVTVNERITQIAVNMERWRHVPHAFGESYVAVNVADATLSVVQNGERTTQMRTIIGDVKHPTPTFGAAITGVTVNPPWTIPASIAAKEILPKLKRNPKYLAENEISILNREADPFGLAINWGNLSGRGFPFQLRQRPGSKNPLGLIKFEMSNAFDIYLHDTPAKSLFALPRRGLSHGCVRIEEPETLALRLLPEQTLDQIREVIAEGTTKTLALAHPLPVYILYWTAFPGENGEVTFRDDLYGRDPAIARALQLRRSAPPLGTNPLVSKDDCPPYA